MLGAGARGVTHSTATPCLQQLPSRVTKSAARPQMVPTLIRSAPCWPVLIAAASMANVGRVPPRGSPAPPGSAFASRYTTGSGQPLARAAWQTAVR
jgi:hypothetical protein